MAGEVNPDIERLASVAGLTQAIYDHPEAGPEFDKLVEKVFPNARNTRHDVRRQAEAALSKVDEKLEEFNKRLAREQADRELAQERAAIREYGFTDADLPEIEKLMAEGPIGSYAKAAEMLHLRREVGRPTNGAPERWQMPSEKMGERYKGILDARGKYNPDWGLQKGYEAFNELQAAKKGTFGL